MGDAAAGIGAPAALDRFFASYYARRPVTATFTGVHDHDRALPDWSLEGLGEAADEMVTIRRDLRDATAGTRDPARRFPETIDLTLAEAFLQIQIAEHDGPHFQRGNPALWSGEAIFSVIALVTRPFAPLEVRLEAAAARMQAIPAFLKQAPRVLRHPPAAWVEKALRECAAAEILFGRSLPVWIRGSGASPGVAADAIRGCGVALEAFRDLAAWAKALSVSAPYSGACGEDLLALLLTRGHCCETPVDELLSDASRDLESARAELDRRIRTLGASDWTELAARLAADRPSSDGYLARFEATWTRFRRVADEHDLVTWPGAPIRYVPIPPQTRDAAPLLYYLFYRSPAPFDRLPIHDYVVMPIDDVRPDERERRLAAANNSAIALNHVVHHGGIGHHVQNWYAARSASRIGQVAAVDASCRIAMFGGGTLAEGWACYVCDLMEEIGALDAMEAAAQQHTRVRLLSRAVVDLSLHTGRISLDEAVAFYQARGLMPAAAARAEAVKTSMFPGTAVMYWLGTTGIHDLRRAEQSRLDGRLSLRRFHDTLLSAGAIPVPLIADLMSREEIPG